MAHNSKQWCNSVVGEILPKTTLFQVIFIEIVLFFLFFLSILVAPVLLRWSKIGSPVLGVQYSFSILPQSWNNVWKKYVYIYIPNSTQRSIKLNHKYLYIIYYILYVIYIIFYILYIIYYLWYMIYDIWYMIYDILYILYDILYIIYDILYIIYDILYIIYDILYFIYYIINYLWYMIYYIWYTIL